MKYIFFLMILLILIFNVSIIMIFDHLNSNNASLRFFEKETPTNVYLKNIEIKKILNEQETKIYSENQNNVFVLVNQKQNFYYRLPYYFKCKVSKNEEGILRTIEKCFTEKKECNIWGIVVNFEGQAFFVIYGITEIPEI